MLRVFRATRSLLASRICAGNGPTRTEFAEAAGIADSELFHGPTMGAAQVARVGYDAMMAGKSSVIAGARNHWMMRGARLLPRSWVAARTRRLNLGQ